MTFRLGIVTDLHVARRGAEPASWHHPFLLESAVALVEAAVDEIAGQGADAVVVCGDLTQHGTGDEARAVLARLEAAGRPVHVAVGNHDVGEAGDRVPALIGPPTGPRAGRLRLVDGTGTRVAPGIRIAGTGVASDDGGWHSRATDVADTGAWADDLTIWITHYPTLTLGPRLAAAGLSDAGDLVDDNGQRDALLARRAPTLVVHGHQHVRAVTCTGAVAQWSQAALVEPPHDVTVLTVTGAPGRWDVEARATPLLGGRRPPNALCPETVRLSWAPGGWTLREAA